jgi:uncharacterized protein (TIGR00730 family)
VTTRRDDRILIDGAVKTLAVFCGSSSGFDSTYREAAEQLGAALAVAGHQLVYGGGHVGLMGVVADAVMAGGGEVVGVITEQLHALEVAHRGLTLLEVEATMHARKARMADLADGVIVLPGGFGTFDETFEILTWNQLGIVSIPVVFFDVDGFYSPLLEFIAGAVAAGFMKSEHGALAMSATTAAHAIELATKPAGAFTPKWVG